MLSIQNISKSFTGRGVVLDNLDLEISAGDLISITGPSGSGKTTLMNIIGLLDRPDSGAIFFMDRSIQDLDNEEAALYRNRNIGFVFQEHLLLPHLTVIENIVLPLMASKISDEVYREKYDYGLSLMEKTSISDLRDKFPYQISGGEAQRATVVRALINKPSILLADEPTGSLDHKNSEVLGEMLREINNELGIALLLATHSTDLAKKMNLHLKLIDGKLVN
jgi:lipoprotein-releasing system ATP-binding protein